MLAAQAVSPHSGNPPKQVIVFLHGYGADGSDLIELAGEFMPLFPDAVFVSPNAPEPCEMSSFGFQWFSLLDRSEKAMLAGAKKAAPILNNFLDETLERFGLPDNKMALIGFSQGTMISLYAALRRPDPIAALVGFSGALVGGGDLAQEITVKPPVMLIHGDQDAVVPFGAMAMAANLLQQNNVPVQAIPRPGLGHGIDGPGLMNAIDFLHQHLL